MFRLVCVGVGHVGLPLSLKLWQAGHHVSLVDVDTQKIERLKSGVMPFYEEGCDELLARAHGDLNFQPLSYVDESVSDAVGRSDYIILTLGTPLGTDYTFRFDQYFDVLDRFVRHLKPGVTLVVRSTVAPHFTRNVVTAHIASERDWIPGVDFFASFCPERLVQGQALQDIDDLPEIIGADDPETARHAAALFQSMQPGKLCRHVSTVEAELAKLYLNTYRYTLFGLANEFALVAEQYGANVFQILDAANAGYPRGGIPRPGPSRGPCLGKDTATLAFSTTAGLIAHAAIKTNENLVLYAAQELRSALRSFAGRRVCIFGIAFKADSDDTRDNLTAPFVNLLDREGAVTCVYDPRVCGYDDAAVVRGSDAVVLMTSHREFKDLSEDDLVSLCARDRDRVFVFDLWNIWPWSDRVFGRGIDEKHEDISYRGVGVTHARGGSSSH